MNATTTQGIKLTENEETILRTIRDQRMLESSGLRHNEVAALQAAIRLALSVAFVPGQPTLSRKLRAKLEAAGAPKPYDHCPYCGTPLDGDAGGR